jgi:hypothetical protein
MARRTLAVAVLLSIGLSATAAVLFMKPRWSGRVHRAVDPPITEADAAHLAAFADSIGSAGLVVIQGGREVFAWGDVDVPR